MVKSYYLISNLLILFFLLFLSHINNALGQIYKIPDNFIEGPFIYSYETNLKGISRVTPVGDIFSNYSSLELSLVKSSYIRSPNEWLKDKIYDVLGEIAETERLLRNKDSPLSDPIFEQFKHLPIFVDDTMQQLALNPLVFCKKIASLYNKAGKFYELNCTIPFGFFNNYLILRLQNEKKNWYFTKITTLNYNRLLDFLIIADSFQIYKPN